MELLTVQETALLLKVAPITVRRFIAAGRLTAVKAGRGVRVYKDSVENFVEPVVLNVGDSGSDSIKGQPLTYDDPLWALVGSATDAAPTDASRKYEYLAEALAPTQP